MNADAIGEATIPVPVSLFREVLRLAHVGHEKEFERGLFTTDQRVEARVTRGRLALEAADAIVRPPVVERARDA